MAGNPEETPTPATRTALSCSLLSELTLTHTNRCGGSWLANQAGDPATRVRYRHLSQWTHIYRAQGTLRNNVRQSQAKGVRPTPETKKKKKKIDFITTICVSTSVYDDQIYLQLLWASFDIYIICCL